VVRAFDVRTGALRWKFNLIPHPGEFGYDTWPEGAYETATGLMPWPGQSLDEARGIVYVATKTAEPDFYGGERHGQNLFANTLLALNAATGERSRSPRNRPRWCASATPKRTRRTFRLRFSS
jgi:quinoprotein glucose dehydrogenase